MTDYEWFVVLKGKVEGPFSLLSLKRMEQVTPDTYVWKEGMEGWKRARDVEELAELFFDENSKNEEEEILAGSEEGEDLALSLPNEQPPILFWIIFFLILITYGLFHFLYAS